MRIRAANRGTGGVFAAVLRGIGVCLAAVVFACAQASAAPFGYVANGGSNTVSVIDAATNTVVATIPVGNAPRGIAVSRNGSRAYVTNVFGGTVSVIDTASNTVVATIPVGNLPEKVAVSPDGRRIYVTNLSDGTVTVIDTASNTVIAKIPVVYPEGVAVSLDGKRAYVPSLNDSTVSVVDTASNTVIAKISLGQPENNGTDAASIAISPDGKHAYVAYDGYDGSGNNGAWLAAIDIGSNTVVAWAPVGAFPTEVAVTPDGKRVYVSNFYGDLNPCFDCYYSTVSVIDTATNTAVTSIQLGDPAHYNLSWGVAISPDGMHAYVTNPDPTAVNPNVYVIDTAINTVIANIPMPGQSYGIAFLPPASVPSSGTACNGTYNGTFKGNINVSAGQNCSFVGGGVTGNVVVTGGNFAFANGLIGGSVGIAGASTFTLGPATTINGSLGIGLVARGTTTDQVCGVTVLHDFGVAGAASPLQIGSAPPASCAGNTIGGIATIDLNTAAIGFYGNSVTGSLSCVANKSITGGGNTAKRKLGQCTAF